MSLRSLARSVHRRLLPPDSPIGWTPYVWLPYLLFLYANWAFRQPGRAEVAATVAATAVFLPLYFRGFWLAGRRLVPVLAGIVALGAALAPVNPSASVFFIYAAAHVGSLGRPRQAVLALAAIQGVVVLEGWLLGFPFHFWFWPILIGTLVGLANTHFAEIGRKNAALRLSQDEVRRLAAAAERERIARDLHDLLGHTLSVITLKAELAGRLVDRDPARAHAEIGEVELISRTALAQVREAVGGYRSATLAAELANARVGLAAAGLRLEAAVEATALPPAVDAALGLVVREAVTNVIRHARGASTCRVTLARAADRVRLEVANDGRRPGALHEGAGMAGMRERLGSLGGELRTGTGPGFVLRAEVPLAPGAT